MNESFQLQSSSGDHSTFAGLAGNVGPFAPPECTPGSVRVYGMQGGDGYDLGPKIYDGCAYINPSGDLYCFEILGNDEYKTR